MMDQRSRGERRKQWLIGEKVERPVSWSLMKLRRSMGKSENCGLKSRERAFPVSEVEHFWVCP